MNDEIQMLAVELDGKDGLVVRFPDGTTEVQRVFALRLPSSTRIEAAKIAKHQGLSLNHFITSAVAEKIARLEFLLSEPVDSDKA
jgi:hypothetical protein